MLPTTASFDSAIKATVRKFRARVEVTWVDSDIDPTIVCTSNDYNRINDAAEVPSGNDNLQHAADGKTVPPYKYAHLDQYLIADGSFHPFPGTAVLSAANETGWWGKTECNSNAEWIDSTTPLPTTTAIPSGANPILTITFANRAINALLVTGESIYNEYPVSFEVRIYLGAALIHTETVINSVGTDWTLDGVSWRKTLPDLPILYNCDSMQLEIIKWSRPHRVVKIVEFYTGIVETYYDDDILNMNLLEEMLISDGSLPVGNISANELDLKLQNVEDRFFVGNTSSPIYTMIKRNRRIRAWLGTVLPPFNVNPLLETVEWIPLGIFWSGDWQAEELGTYVSTSARDRMELLRKSMFEISDIYEDVTLFDLATTVMADAKLKMADMVYNIDASLAAITLQYAWFGKVSYFECIREICEACQGYAYVDRYGVVQIAGTI